MSRLFLVLFALTALGEGIHVTVGYLREMKGLPPLRGSRFFHWFFVLGLLVLWFVWNHFRTLP